MAPEAPTLGVPGMPRDAAKTGANAADQIDRDIGPSAIKRSARAQIPQAPHVERDVHDATMDEDAGEQSPPFSR